MKLKRILATILCFAMVFGTMSFPTLATETSYVAKIGETYYENFDAAMNAVKDAVDTVEVEIYEKVTLNQNLSGSYNSIKFVGKNESAEIYLDVQGYITATDKAVAFENLKLSKSAGGFIGNAGFMNVAFGVYDVNRVTYTGCTFLNGAYASSGEVTFSGCTFYRSHDKYGLWAYGNVDCVVDGCTFDDYRGIKMYAEGAAKTVDLTVKNTDFTKLDSKPAIVLTYGESVTLEGNTYSDTGVFELDLDGAPNGTPVNSDVAPTCVNDNGVCGVLVDGKIYTTVAEAAEVAQSGSTVTLLHNSTETVAFPEGVTLDKNGYEAAGVKVNATVAKIGDTKYNSLQDAVDAVLNGETITLAADCADNVTIVQTPDVRFTIDGNGNTMSGTFTIDGKSAAYATAGLNIKNINFDATSISKDASINLGGTNATRYTSNVSVDSCTFTGTGNTKVAVKNYTGGCKNVTITNCTATGLHSLAQLKTSTKVTVIGCEVTDCKNGVSLGSSTDVTISNNSMTGLSGYGVRPDGDAEVTISDCEIKAFIPVVVRKASAGTALTFNGTNTMTASNDDGYWLVVGKDEYEEGKDLPYTEAKINVTINDSSLSANGVYNKVAPSGSNSLAYTKEVDGYVRVWGEGGGNAEESFVLKLYSGSEHLATTTLNNVGGIINGNVYVTWNFFYPASNDPYWTTVWHLAPSSNYQPTHVELIIDGVVVATTDARMSGADNVNPVVWKELGGVIAGLSGEGTEESPYLINNRDDLMWFRAEVDKQASDGSTQFAGKYFKLTSDIDLAGINWNPIGSMSGDHGSFKGIFDGDNHKISNLYVEQAGNGIGLFARTAGNAVIKNLTLENVTVKSTDNSNYVGGVVANSFASTKIENVHVKGSIDISGRGYIGGISGHGFVVMDNVSVIGEGTIKSTFWCAGGILGYGGEGTTNIKNAKVEGTGTGLTITSAAGGLGAIVGMAEDNHGTQPIAGSNLSAKDVTIKTYTGAYGDAYANYALGYLYGGNETTIFTGTNTVENVVVETSSGEAPDFSDAVAKIGDKIYFTLASALEAVNTGDTIELMRDITYGLANCAYNDGTYVDAVRYNGDASFTIDFDGHTITDDGCVNDYLIYLNNKGAKENEITFKNGTIISKNGCWAAVCVGASTSLYETVLNLHSMNIENSNGAAYSGNLVVRARNMATVNANEGTVITSDNASYGIAASTSDAVVNIKGAKVTQKNSVNAGGNHTCAAVGGKGVISIYDGSEIISDASGVHTMTTGTPLIYVYGGSITAQSEAIVASTNGGAGEISTVYVYGGTIKGALKETNNDSNVIVSGGIFDRDVTEFLANGCSIKDNQDGTYGVINSNVARIGDSLYATLQQAFDAAQDGDTIAVISDVVITEETRTANGVGYYEGVNYLGDKDITLDLKGYKVTDDGCVNDRLLRFENNGTKENTITIKNGTIEASSKAYSAVAFASVNANKITLNLEDVDVVLNGRSDGYGAAVLARGGAVVNVKDGTVITAKSNYAAIEAVSTVNIYDGAEIYQNGTTSYCGALVGVSGNGTINVYGGYGKSAMGGFIAMTSGGTINVYGGEWIANTDGTYANGNKSVLIAQSANGASSVINVYGGQFAGGYNCYGDAVGDAKINISGGTFNVNPDGQSYVYIADGYSASYSPISKLYHVIESRTLTLVAKGGVDTTQNGIVVEAGESFTIDVMPSGLEDAAGAKWELVYDSARFTLDELTTDYRLMTTNKTKPEIIKDNEKNYFEEGKPVATYTFTAKTDIILNDEADLFALKNAQLINIKETWLNMDVTAATITVDTYVTIIEPRYVVEVKLGQDSDYVDANTKLVLVYTQNEHITFDYKGVQMFDVSQAGYKYNDSDEYKKVFALVVSTKDEAGEFMTELSDYEANVAVDYNGTSVVIDYSEKNDINLSKTVTWLDVISIYSVLEHDEEAFNNFMAGVIKADVNLDRVANSADAKSVIDEVYPTEQMQMTPVAN